MPIYEYACEAGHKFEKREGFNGNTITTCPECATKARRIIHVPAVHYKGSGFYTTDHGRSSSYDSESKKDSGSDSGTASSEGDSSKESAKPSKKDSSSEKSTSTSKAGSKGKAKAKD